MDDNFRAWENTFNNHGISISKREYFKSEGLPTKDLAIKYLKLNDRDSNLFSFIVKEKETHYMQNHFFKLFPTILFGISCVVYFMDYCNQELFDLINSIIDAVKI